MELLLNMPVPLRTAFAAEVHLAEGQINNNNNNTYYYPIIY